MNRISHEATHADKKTELRHKSALAHQRTDAKHVSLPVSQSAVSYAAAGINIGANVLIVWTGGAWAGRAAGCRQKGGGLRSAGMLGEACDILHDLSIFGHND